MAAIPSDAERAVCAAICRSGGLRAKEIAKQLDVSTETVNKVLYRSPFLKELCWQDGEYRWHIEPDETAVITAYKGIANRVHIPETLGGRRVTGIGERAFAGITSMRTVEARAAVPPGT